MKSELDKLREELKEIELDDEKIRDSFLSVMDKTVEAIWKDIENINFSNLYDKRAKDYDDAFLTCEQWLHFVKKEIKQMLKGGVK